MDRRLPDKEFGACSGLTQCRTQDARTSRFAAKAPPGQGERRRDQGRRDQGRREVSRPRAQGFGPLMIERPCTALSSTLGNIGFASIDTLPFAHPHSRHSAFQPLPISQLLIHPFLSPSHTHKHTTTCTHPPSLHGHSDSIQLLTHMPPGVFAWVSRDVCATAGAGPEEKKAEELEKSEERSEKRGERRRKIGESREERGERIEKSFLIPPSHINTHPLTHPACMAGHPDCIQWLTQIPPPFCLVVHGRLCDYRRWP